MIDHHSNYIIEISGLPLPVKSEDNISFESCSFHLCSLYKRLEMGAFHIFLHNPPLHQMPWNQLGPATQGEDTSWLLWHHGWAGPPHQRATTHLVTGLRFITTSMSNESTQYRYGIYYYMTIRWCRQNICWYLWKLSVPERGFFLF